MKVRFGVFTDLHTEFIHDAPQRVESFLKDCKKQNVDFCIELGDFCPPGEMNKEHKKTVLNLITDYNIPFYHALGNHDMDNNCKADVLDKIGLSNSYYSFDFGGVHFIVLDTCYYKNDESDINYKNGNYHKAEPEKIAILPGEQLLWLEKELENTKFPSVCFSHHSLTKSRAGICNYEQFDKVVKQSPCGVILCVCGHEHVDRLELIDRTHYYCLNSMSYYWAGSKYSHDTYGKETELKFPFTRKVFPYSNPLYAIIEINDDEINITGKSGDFVGKTPRDINFEKTGLTDPITTSIIDRTIKIRQG
jgi:3',5'-cyclic AMP phosphodiesterase CpdA